MVADDAPQSEWHATSKVGGPRARRIAVVVSHPIQHFCPQYSSWAEIDGVDLKVFFASRHGLDAYKDENFGRTVKWDLVLDFPHEFLPGAAGRQLGAGMDCPQLGDQLSKFAPEMLVIYGYSQALQRRAMRWARARSTPIAMVGDSELRSDRSLLVRVAKSIVLPKVLTRVDLFLSVGDANESFYRRYGVPDQKLVRCFFPIDVKAFDAVTERRAVVRAELRRELNIPQDQSVVLMVGKLVGWKRQRDLVEFSNRLQQTKRDVTVILAGTGPDEQALRGLSKKVGPGGVLFAGFVPPAKLVEYYAAADAYAHCSEVEPHSLAISEAIYSGLPVVLSDQCGSYGPSDDVRHGLNGFTYPCGNVAELSSALLQVLERPSLHQSMARASIEISRANQALAHGRALSQAMEVLRLAR